MVEVTSRSGDMAVLKRFDRVDGVWTERVPAPVVPDRARAELVGHALYLLSEDAPLERIIEQKARDGVSTRDLKNLLDDHIDQLRTHADALQSGEGFTHGKLVEKLSSWTQRRQDLLIKVYSTTPYPEAEGLRYLHEQQRISIEYRGPRKVLKDNSSMDEYAIRLRDSKAGKPKKSSGPRTFTSLPQMPCRQSSQWAISRPGSSASWAPRMPPYWLSAASDCIGAG